MALASLQIVLAALAGVTPVSAAPQADADVASLYDQATCAAIYGEADDWARAAIGEDEAGPPTLDVISDVEVAHPAPSTACNDRSLGAKWREMLIACSTLHRPELVPCGLGIGRAATAPRSAERRAQRVTLEVSGDTGPPISPPRERDVPRALHDFTRALLVPPPLVGLLVAAAPAPLRSITGDELLRPPRA